MPDTDTADVDECTRCKGTGVIGLRIRTGTYAGAGPVPDDSRKFIDATCDECRGVGYIEAHGDDE
jgi:DnaJ-class molecular chaperone